ncbi:MAG: putative porin [Chthoniobacterales bacterium]
MKKSIITAVAAALCFGPVATRAQDAGALLDLLVKKHIINDQEAEEVRSELTREVASSPAGKWKLSTPITELELYGDARIRYEVRNGETGPPSELDPKHDTFQRNRSRYRLRLGLRGTLADDWFFGVRLETNQNPRSTNVTFGDDSSSSSGGGGGPFAKGSDGINVGQAYLGYKGLRDIILTAGKMPNPFVTTPMTWDGDINPEGISEQWKHTFNLNFGGAGGESSAAAASYSKDGKNVATASSAAPEPHKIAIDVFANFAQFVYDDTNPDNPIGPSPSSHINTDAFMLGWQVGAKVNFSKTMYLQLAPTLYNYTGTGDTFNKAFSGDPAFTGVDSETGLPAKLTRNQTGVNSLLVFDMPAEFGWNVGEIPFRVFGDFAVNFDGDERAEAAGHPGDGDQRYAYQIGLGIGKIKVKHDWAISAYWQHTEQYALDPNLVDSDLFDSRVNMEGFAVSLGYALSDAVTTNLTYGWGERSEGGLGTGGVGDIGVNPLRRYQIFQADLSLKF